MESKSEAYWPTGSNDALIQTFEGGILMRRKAAIALMLALVLLASSLSAAAAYRDGTYNGYYYELVATCSGKDVYVRTSCASRTYTVEVAGYIYRYNNSDRPYTTIGPESDKSSISLNSTYAFSPAYVLSYHYINNVNIGSLHASNS